jgi:N-acetylmuramoyl-L-alanine amidase
MKIAIVAGHSSASPGVCVEEFREFDLAREMRDAVCALLAARGIEAWVPPGDHEADQYPEYLTQPIREINAAHPAAAVEMHCNSGLVGPAHYSLCLYAQGSRLGRALARRIVEATHVALVPWNTIPPQCATDMEFRGKRAAFVQDTRCPAVIAEPFFLSNPRVREFLRTGRAEVIGTVARATADAISDWIVRERIGR